MKRPLKQVKNQKMIAISFGDKSYEGIQYPYNDALVVMTSGDVASCQLHHLENPNQQ